MKSKILNVGALVLLMSSCGTDPTSETSSSETDSADAQASADSNDDHLIPPKEYYDELMRENLALLDDPTPATRPVLYLNFDGGTVAKGYSVGQSFIVCRGQAKIPASNFNADQRAAIIKEAQSYYVKAGTSLLITDRKPAARPYTTMFVGGSMRDLNCVDSRSTLGVAPLDSGNANKNDIGFAFTRYTQNLKVIGQTIAHEAGHSFGLNHIKERKGLMYPMITSDIVGFIVGTVSVGRKQDEPALLQRDVGKAAGNLQDPNFDNSTPSVPTPSVNPVAPNTSVLDGLADLINGFNPGNLNPGMGGLSDILKQLFSGIIPSNGGLPNFGGIGGLPGIDSLVAILGGISPTPLPGPGGKVSIQDILANIHNGGTGGIDLSTLLSQISQYSGTNTTNLTGGQTLPDFANAMGIDQLGSVGDLFNSMASSKQYVLSQYTGSTRSSLLSYLKVAYAQAYQNQGQKP